jgi:polymerase delta-interacting protein 2
VHKLFGFRGVVVFPWTANVIESTENSSMDANQYDKLITDELSFSSENENELVRTIKPRKLTYYQVLIDERDIPFIRAHPEAVTFLHGPENNRSVYSIMGLDYVSQNDVLPYTSTDHKPLRHELFDRFDIISLYISLRFSLISSSSKQNLCHLCVFSSIS